MGSGRLSLCPALLASVPVCLRSYTLFRRSAADNRASHLCERDAFRIPHERKLLAFDYGSGKSSVLGLGEGKALLPGPHPFLLGSAYWGPEE